MDFQTFWRMHFPEQELLSREQALQTAGQEQITSMEEMRNYQDRVASVYGAYELQQLQLVTMEKLLPPIAELTRNGTMVSLGCGPASYELWLITQNFVKTCTLVDISPRMLERASLIARDLKIDDRVETVCGDAAEVMLPPKSADICISVNALHWSDQWRKWIKQAVDVTKPGGLVFFSGTLHFPQSNFTREQFLGVAERGIKLLYDAYIVEGGPIINGQRAQLLRYYFVGHTYSLKEIKHIKRSKVTTQKNNRK